MCVCVCVALVNYLAKLYCICALWHSDDIDQIGAVNPTAWHISNDGAMTDDANMIWLRYDNNDATDVDHLVRLGINAGCQVNWIFFFIFNLSLIKHDIACVLGHVPRLLLLHVCMKNNNNKKRKGFIVTPNTVIDFFDSFDRVRFNAENRFHFMHVVVMPANGSRQESLTASILNHSVIHGE